MSSSPSETDASRNELEPGRERPAVGEQDALHLRGVQAPTVHLVRDAERLGVRERARGTVDVGDPADALLQVAARVRDHRGIQAHAAHHDERALFARAVVAADRGEAHVHRVRVAVEGRLHHRRGIGQRQQHVAGQQVAGAARNDRERHSGAAHRLGDRPHGAVAAGHEHGVRPRLERFAG